jgi:hypothetical protein
MDIVTGFSHINDDVRAFFMSRAAHLLSVTPLSYPTGRICFSEEDGSPSDNDGSDEEWSDSDVPELVDGVNFYD